MPETRAITATRPAPGVRRIVHAQADPRRVLGVVVAVALAAGLVASGLVILLSGLNPDSVGQAAAGAPASVAGTDRSTTSAAAVTGGPTTAAQFAAAMAPPEGSGDVPAPGSDVSPVFPQSGPGLTVPGILFIASPAPDGSFDVVERVWLASGVSSLTLRPAPVGGAGRQFATATAGASDVRVRAGDQLIVLPQGTVGAETVVPVQNVARFELQYRLTDVTVRSTPSTAGRALAALGPLTALADQDLPVLTIVPGETVLGLYCPLLPFNQQSCGGQASTGSGAERELLARAALTTVQFNLPPA